MKRSTVFLTSIAAICGIAAAPLAAQHGRGSMGSPPGGFHGAPPAAAHADGAGNRGVHGDDHISGPKAQAAGQPIAHDNKVADHISRDPALASRLQPLLPASANLQTAAQGFRSQGQFIAALHVSRNLNIPFDQLRARMTGPNAESLGRAIHDLRPNLDNKAVKTQVKTAEQQAKADAKQAERAEANEEQQEREKEAKLATQR
jgi:ribosomal protein S20